MSGYDIFLIAVVAVSIAMGLIRGFVREMFSLAGVVLGVVLALIASPALSESLRRVIPSDSASFAAAFLIIFFATLIVVSVLGVLLTKVLDMARLGFPNRLLGGGFGLVRGVLTALVITLGLTLFLSEDSSLLRRSRLVPHVAFGTRLIAPLLPRDVEAILLERIDHLPRTRFEVGSPQVSASYPNQLADVLVAPKPRIHIVDSVRERLRSPGASDIPGEKLVLHRLRYLTTCHVIHSDAYGYQTVQR